MSICVNHTSRAATARCSSCHKPICDECVVKESGTVFCSQACAVNAARFNANFKPDRGPGFFGSIKNMIVSLVGLAFVLAVGVAICAYVLKIGFFVNLLKSIGL